MPEPKKILLIDDDQSIKNALRMILAEDKYDLLYCNSVSCGEKTVKQGEVDLVILDLMVPNSSGFEFLDFVKQQHIAVKIIILSAMNTATAATAAFQRGACDYITKPFASYDILSRIENALSICKEG